MKIPTFKHSALTLVLALGLCAWPLASANDVIVGFNRVKCLPKSDTLVSVPFMKQPLKATSQLVAPPNLAKKDQATLTPAAGTAWTPGELKHSYYLRFTSGALAGHWYDILENTATTVTIDLNGENVSRLATGDRFIIVEHWTLDTLFPPKTQKTFHVSTGTLGYQQKSKLLIPNAYDSGSNLPPKEIYFLTAEGWRQSSLGYPQAGNTILPPGLPLMIRHPDGVVATDFMPLGEVLQSTDSIWLAESKVGPQDNPIAVFRPVDMTLGQAGLDGLAFRNSVSHSVRGDQLLVFNNGVEGFNKKPSAIYYKLSNAWFRDVGKLGSNPSAVNEKALSASGGVIIRKSKGTYDSAVLWKNQAP